MSETNPSERDEGRITNPEESDPRHEQRDCLERDRREPPPPRRSALANGRVFRRRSQRRHGVLRRVSLIPTNAACVVERKHADPLQNIRQKVCRPRARGRARYHGTTMLME